jgi:molybdenum cofactor cytidylyltransferase
MPGGNGVDKKQSSAVAGVILAAGESRRMGRCKATLPIGDGHLLGMTLSALQKAGLDPVVVVTGCDHDEIKKALGEISSAILVNNPDCRRGQISSLQCALKRLKSAEAVVMALIDHPGFSEALVLEMVRVYQDKNVAGVIPRYQGRNGHPVLFGRKMTEALLALDENQTARDVVRDFQERIHYLDTEEEAVVRDLDCPEDYEGFLQRIVKSE